jgi:hypothetical protein
MEKVNEEKIRILNNFAEEFIKRGELDPSFLGLAEQMVRKLPQNIRIPKMERIAEKYIEAEWFEHAKDIIKLLPEEKRVQLMKKVKEVHETGKYLYRVATFSYISLPQSIKFKEIEKIVKECIEKGMPQTARIIAYEFLPKEELEKAIGNLVDGYILEGIKNEKALDLARRAALLLPEQQKNQKLLKIVDKYIEREILDEAKYTALVLPNIPESFRAIALFEIENAYLKKGLFRFAREIVYELPEPYISKELKRIEEFEKEEWKLRTR